MLALLVTLNTALNFDAIKREYLYFHNLYHSEAMQITLTAQKEMQKLIGAEKQELTILMDSLAPTIYSGFHRDINLAINYHGDRGKEPKSEYDYILLHSDSTTTRLSAQEFATMSAKISPDSRRIRLAGRAMIQSLIETGRFRKSNYKIIYDKNKLTLFERIAPPQ